MLMDPVAGQVTARLHMQIDIDLQSFISLNRIWEFQAALLFDMTITHF